MIIILILCLRLSSLESGILADEEENMKLVSLHSPGGECHSNDTQQKQLEENRLSSNILHVIIPCYETCVDIIPCRSI